MLQDIFVIYVNCFRNIYIYIYICHTKKAIISILLPFLTFCSHAHFTFHLNTFSFSWFVTQVC